MKTENAKPCPFCGSTNLEPKGADDDPDHWVECQDCMAQGPVAQPPDEGEIDLDVEAIELWNKRVEPKRSECETDSFVDEAAAGMLRERDRLLGR